MLTAVRSNSIGAKNWVRKSGLGAEKGFGSMVIERNLARALDAKVDLEFDPDGLHCHIVIPANQILALR